MFSAIISGPIWAELLTATIGKALITGGLSVVKAGPVIKKIVESSINDSNLESNPVIDVFKEDINK